MDLSELEPSIEGLVQPFLHRYHAGTEDVSHLWSFSYHHHGVWLKATLTTSGIAREDRSFEGKEWCYSSRLAEMSAIRVFREDADVRRIAKRLPPTMARMRDSCRLKKDEKAAVRAAGIDPRVVVRELVQAVYMHFRDLGCRTALWDGIL
eukprot:Skav211775  [mRNA]  locus=scaffold305:59966:60415:+ [translate_table: standard]